MVFPLLEVSGDNFSCGLQIGTNFSDNITRAMDKSFFYAWLRIQHEKDPSKLDNFIQNSTNKYPEYVQEINGIAEGANLPVQDVFLLNFRHSYNYENCSTVGMIDQTQKRILLAHNEDHDMVLGKYGYIIKQICEDGTWFLAHCYPGSLPGTSFWCNSHGLGMSGNALTEPGLGVGTPKILFERKALQSHTLSELLNTLQSSGRVGGYSYNIFSLHDLKLLNLETTSKDAVITECNDTLAHTNHYITDQLKKISANINGNTVSRLNGCRTGLLNAEFSEEALRSILFNDEVHVYNEFETPWGKGAAGTFATVIFDVDASKNTLCMTLYEADKDLSKIQMINLDISS